MKTLTACVAQFREYIEPHIEAFVLKLELPTLTLVCHPETARIVALLPSPSVGKQISVNNFLLKCNQPDYSVDVSFQLELQDQDGFTFIHQLHYSDVPIKLYQIRAIVQ